MEEIQRKMVLSQMRMAEEDYKQKKRQETSIAYLQQKFYLEEQERERKKSQCDLLSIDDNGNIRVQTTNLRVEAHARRVTNFSHPEMLILERLKNPDSKIFLVTCSLGNDLRFALFDNCKCGSATYVLKKLAAIGAEIFAPTLAGKKQYAQQILALLIQNATEIQRLPDRRGWYVNENNKIQFFQGRWTWEEAVKCAM